MKLFGREMTTDEIVTQQSWLFNHFMIATELGFLVVFIYYGIGLLIPFVVLNLSLSAFSYYLIRKNDLYSWLRIIYFICIEIMAAGTVALGFGYGFSLYSISMISVAFYIYYIGKRLRVGGKLRYKQLNPLFVPVLTMLIYFVCYLFVDSRGVIYVINDVVQKGFFMYNSAVVFSIVIIYMFIYLNQITETEDKLEKLALVDNLTGLYNRHYMLSYLAGLEQETLSGSWIAIMDADNFKRVNDVYGHNCGDYVLRTVADLAKTVCSSCTVCRWGGEEFIIFSDSDDTMILEELRKAVADHKMEFGEYSFSLTVTIGVDKYSGSRSLDQWISDADKKLYAGKSGGKNRVVS